MSNVKVSWSPIFSCRKTSKENIKEKKKVKEDKNGSKLQTAWKAEGMARGCSGAGADTRVRAGEQRMTAAAKVKGEKDFVGFLWVRMDVHMQESLYWNTSSGFLSASYRSWRVFSCSKCFMFLNNSSKIASVCVTTTQFCIAPWKYCQVCVHVIPNMFVRLPEDSVAENTQILLWGFPGDFKKPNQTHLRVKVKPYSFYRFASIK